MYKRLLEETRQDLAKYRGQQDRGEGVYDIVRALQERANALELICHFTRSESPAESAPLAVQAASRQLDGPQAGEEWWAPRAG